MERSKVEGKEVVTEEEEEEGLGEDDKKKEASSPSCRKGSGGEGSAQPRCQVDNCTADMTGAKKYHRRHKVCQLHSKAPFVVIAGNSQRFCQQCSRFHEVAEFDEAKRSCRSRLAGHNERRRRSSYEEGDNPQSKANQLPEKTSL